MFTFYSDYHQITGKSHVWAARSLETQMQVCSPLGTDAMAAVHTRGLGPNTNIKALSGRRSAEFKQPQKYCRSY